MQHRFHRDAFSRGLIPACALALLAWPGVAGAVIEEIVVTAQKRAQLSEDVGMSLTVLGEDLLAERRIQGLEHIREAVPSLDIFRGNGSNNPTITLRGIGTTNPWINNNPSIAAHVDGFYLPMSAFLNFPLFDLQRIEVLKGPQVGLYGRNSAGGAINFISRRPAEELSGYLDASYGSYDAFDIQGAIGGALGDTVQGRVAWLYQQGGGYMKRAGTVDSTAGFSQDPGNIPEIPEIGRKSGYGDKDIAAVRTSLAFTPAAHFDALLTMHYGRDQSEQVGSTNINGDVIGAFEPPDDRIHIDYDDFAPFTDAEQFGTVLEMNWQLGAWKLTSVTGYEDLQRDYGIGDFVPIRAAEASFEEELNSFGQELRFDHERDSGLRWLFGAAWSQDDIDYSRVLLSYDFLLGALGTAFEQEDESYSVFTQAEWPLLPAWMLTGSLRYTNEEKRYDGGSFEIDPFGTSNVGAAFPNIRPDGLFASPRFDDDDVSGKIGLDWEPNDETLWYASVGRSFKSGGFDGSGITEPSSFEPFDSETVWAYELGGKFRLFDRRVLAAASVFYYDYDDKQVLALVDLGGGIVEAVIENAASSEIYGVDLELNWSVTQSLSLALNATRIESEVTQWRSADPDEAAARRGNELPGTPDTSLTASVNWQQPLTAAWTLDAGLWGTYTAAAFRDIENNENLRSDSYTVLNGRVALSRGPVSLYLFGRNLFDEEYVTSVRSLVGMLGEYHGAPFTAGIGVRYALSR